MYILETKKVKIFYVCEDYIIDSEGNLWYNTDYNCNDLDLENGTLEVSTGKMTWVED